MSSWLHRHVSARLAASVWWGVMIVLSSFLVGAWAMLVVDPTWPTAISAALFTLLVGWPIAREWPRAARMARMLRDH